MAKIIYHGKIITPEELCRLESLKVITDTMYATDPHCYEVTLQCLSEAGFTELELIYEYITWTTEPLRFE